MADAAAAEPAAETTPQDMTVDVQRSQVLEETHHDPKNHRRHLFQIKNLVEKQFRKQKFKFKNCFEVKICNFFINDQTSNQCHDTIILGTTMNITQISFGS